MQKPEPAHTFPPRAHSAPIVIVTKPRAKSESKLTKETPQESRWFTTLKSIKFIEFAIAAFGSVTLTAGHRANAPIYRYIGNQWILIIANDILILYCVIFFLVTFLFVINMNALLKLLVMSLDFVILAALMVGSILFCHLNGFIFYICTHDDYFSHKKVSLTLLFCRSLFIVPLEFHPLIQHYK